MILFYILPFHLLITSAFWKSQFYLSLPWCCHIVKKNLFWRHCIRFTPSETTAAGKCSWVTTSSDQFDREGRPQQRSQECYGSWDNLTLAPASISSGPTCSFRPRPNYVWSLSTGKWSKRKSIKSCLPRRWEPSYWGKSCQHKKSESVPEHFLNAVHDLLQGGAVGIFGLGRSIPPRLFNSSIIGLKSGTCGELSRSIHIFFGRRADELLCSFKRFMVEFLWRDLFLIC